MTTEQQQSPSLKIKGPTSFDGDVMKWDNWVFKMVAYSGTIDYRYKKAMTEMLKMDRTTVVDQDWIDDFDLNNPAKDSIKDKSIEQLDSDLYAYFTEQLIGNAHPYILREKFTASGLFVFKSLCDRFNTVSKIKAKGLLQEINGFFFDNSDFLQSMLLWETKIAEYDACSGETYADSQKLCHIANYTTGNLKEHLHPNIQTYDEAVGLITHYFTSKENAK